MTRISTFFLIGGPLALIILTAVAGYAYSWIRYLGLPIPDALALFTVVLPIITGISMQGLWGLIQRTSKTEPFQLSIPLVAVLAFQLFYETVVGTLALTYILPPSSLRCGLNDMWQSYFVVKDGHAIQRIQDTFNCCGLNTVLDRAFPFEDQHASQCAQVFGRTESCFGPLRKLEQTQAGLLLLVAVLVFVVKIMSVIFLLTNPTMSRARISRPFKRITNRSEDDEENSRATMRRLIEDSAGGEPYSDNPEEYAASNTAQDAGPRVQPSALIDDHNEWRDEEGNDRRA